MGALEQALKQGGIGSRPNISCLYWVFLLEKPDSSRGLWHVCSLPVPTSLPDNMLVWCVCVCVLSPISKFCGYVLLRIIHSCIPSLASNRFSDCFWKWLNDKILSAPMLLVLCACTSQHIFFFFFFFNVDLEEALFDWMLDELLNWEHSRRWLRLEPRVKGNEVRGVDGRHGAWLVSCWSFSWKS